MTKPSPFRYFKTSSGRCQKDGVERSTGPATLPGMIKPSPFRHFRTSPEIIRLAVML